MYGRCFNLYKLSINPWQRPNSNLIRLNKCEATPARRTKRVKVKNREEEIQGGVVVTFVQTGKDNKKGNVCVQARRSMKL